VRKREGLATMNPDERRDAFRPPFSGWTLSKTVPEWWHVRKQLSLVITLLRGHARILSGEAGNLSRRWR